VKRRICPLSTAFWSRALADAVHAVYLGAACAAAVAFLVLLTAPRRFPVLAADSPDPRSKI
ncbi:hypothetical protein, partial [Streptomyces scabiei]|uniref:hypothetical protein n=1 Tax=Streptomyces scabiei TaxID=1930 RepID=UPI00131DC1A6